jgi:ferredoxin
MCVMSLPEVFGQDPSDGRVVLLRTDLASEHLAAIREAVSLCPSGALSLLPAERPSRKGEPMPDKPGDLA